MPEPRSSPSSRSVGAADSAVDADLDEREPLERRSAGGSAALPSASSSTSSERIASIAVRFGSAWRKTSLNTSSDSGPA